MRPMGAMCGATVPAMNFEHPNQQLLNLGPNLVLAHGPVGTANFAKLAAPLQAGLVDFAIGLIHQFNSNQLGAGR